MSDMERLATIRDQLDAIAPAEWMLASAAERLFIESAGLMGELSEIATFHAGASTDEMQFAASAPQHVRFLLGLVDRAIAAARERQPEAADRPPRAVSRPSGAVGRVAPGTRREAKNYAAEAAMKCAEPAFKKFLMQRHGLESPATDERTAQKLRSLLGVMSRAELNDGGQAAARWKALRGDFDNWRRAGR